MLKTVAKAHGVSVSWLVGESDIRNLVEPNVSRKIADSMADLPIEAVQKIEEYIELIRMKYNRKNANR